MQAAAGPDSLNTRPLPVDRMPLYHSELAGFVDPASVYSSAVRPLPGMRSRSQLPQGRK